MDNAATSSRPAPPRPPVPSSATDFGALVAPVKSVETLMLAFLRGRPLPANLREAAEYALMGPGKRMRPVLALHACRAVGGRFEEAYPPAAAIEMVHAFSLVHDDLPAMDDDDLRRGRPTLHRHASEAMAILVGDALQGLAIELLTEHVPHDALCCRLVRELAVATNDMIAGQVYDTLPEGPEMAATVPPLDRLARIHRNKTGALLRAACRMGALAGSATEAQLDAVTRYADTVGLMFQIVDDLLDVTATTAELGKAVGKDADRGKLTYPGVLGVEESRAEVERLRREAHAALAALGEPADPLRQLCDYMAVRRK